MLNFKVENNKIIIGNSPDFNVQQTLECGQLFRYIKTDFGYKAYSLEHKALIYCQEGYTIIECSNVKYFINYFDLHTNYAKIKLELEGDALLASAIQHGEGIRILKQNSIEAIIGFIISANNNIKRIQNTLFRLCEDHGQNMGDYFSFPTLKVLASLSEEYYKSIGCGYRAQYLAKVVWQLINEFDLDAIESMPTLDAASELTKLYGVGPKVADCILLYGFYKLDTFPVDTWIKKIYYDYNPKMKNINEKQMRKFFVDKFGSLSGYAQQYLFYYKRSKGDLL